MAKILIVDDSLFMRQLLKKILRTQGYEDLFEAKSAKEALKLFKSKKPDLTLLDIVIGDKESGVDILKEVIKLDASAKVIMITVIDQESTAKSCKKLGALAYIRKPVEEKKLLLEVKKALK